MKDELKQEIERLNGLLQSVGAKLEQQAGATEQAIAEVESETEIKLDDYLRDFYRFSDGSSDQYWFSASTECGPFCSFLSLEEALAEWKYARETEEGRSEAYRGYNEKTRDERIKPNVWAMRGWFPIAEFNGFSTIIYFDAAPSEAGKYGQIIVYQHDPDQMKYLADSFLQFFCLSNDLIERDPEEIAIMYNL